MNAASDDAFEAGRQAGFDGRPLESNPHFGGGKSRGGQSVDMGHGPPERGGEATIANNCELQPLRFSTAISRSATASRVGAGWLASGWFGPLPSRSQSLRFPPPTSSL